MGREFPGGGSLDVWLGKCQWLRDHPRCDRNDLLRGEDPVRKRAQRVGASAMRANAPRCVSTLGVLALLGSVVSVVTPSPAQADAKEVYTLFGYQGGVSHYRLSTAGEAAATNYSGAIDLTAYYGLRSVLRNALHVGGRLRLASTSGVLLSGAALTNPDGTRSQGEIHVDGGQPPSKSDGRAEVGSAGA